MAAMLSLAGQAQAQTVHTGDTVIQGSLGLGQDAVNGENFGFDTLRLKENNLRLHFQDTSSTAGFPTTDWRITINDSANNGDNYFSIDDADAQTQILRLDAGAPNFSIFVDGAGYVGIGTNAPAANLQVSSPADPVLRLDQIAGTNPAQAWDLFANDQAFKVVDATAGTTPLKLETNAPDNSFYMDQGGNVGIGTNAPTQTLHVDGTAYIKQTIEVGSSRHLKKEIKPLSLADAKAVLEDLEPVAFKYKNETAQQLGFIAEDVPDLVATASRKSLRPMDFVAVLATVSKAHETRTKELEATVKAQAEMIKRLEAKIDALSVETK
jgi:hypothetical protein